MIKFVCVGKIKEKAMQSMIVEYSKRLSPFTTLQIIEVKDEHIPANNSMKDNEKAKEKEGERILEKIKDQDVVLALDLHGESMTSESFAKMIDSYQTYGASTIVFVIAGSLGYSEQVIKRANKRIKLSDFTFPHQLVRILLLEQVYRSFMILNNQTYHK